MAITQLNSYLPSQNLTNLAENVDYNRVGDDKTDITVNHTTSPWTFTIKVGSLIEKDGNIYTVDTADYTLQATDNAHNYIVFTGTAFASSANRGTYDPAKGGFYDSGNRVLKYYIDPDNDIEYTLVANDSRTENIKTDNLIIDGNSTFNGDINGSLNIYDFNDTSSAPSFSNIATGAATNYIILEIYKSCSFLFNLEIIVSSSSGASVVQTATVEIDINGSWEVETSTNKFYYDTLSNTISPQTLDTQSIVNFTPGKYRIKHNITKSGSSPVTVTFSAYIGGCFAHDDTNTADGVVFSTT